MPVAFYRYLSNPMEVHQIQQRGKVNTVNPGALGTWYTANRYHNPGTAKRELALSRTPTHQVGPIPSDEMPHFRIGLRPVAPANGEPGGGVEACTREPVWLLGLYNWNGTDWAL